MNGPNLNVNGIARMILRLSPLRFAAAPAMSQRFLLTVCITVLAGAGTVVRGQIDRSIVAWGATEPVPSPNTDFVAVSACGNHSLGLKADGSIVAWGPGPGQAPLPNSGFMAIAAGERHSLGLKSDGSIVAWGDNSAGQLNVPTPNSGFVEIVAGGYMQCIFPEGTGCPGYACPPFCVGLDFSLGLKSNGSIVAWGYNGSGQCNVPAPNADFVRVSAGILHSVGLKADGSIVGWGGNGFPGSPPLPNSNFEAVAAGAGHCLGVKTDGTIVAWGSNDYGECNVPSPNAGFVDVAAGGFILCTSDVCLSFGYSLGLKADGSIVAWGYNGSGQCNVPAPNTGFVALAAGASHSLGLRTGARGDMNCDSFVDLADVPLFVEALLATGAFDGCNLHRADMNADTQIDGRDAQPFVAVLVVP